jgi:hypothetical protein
MHSSLEAHLAPTLPQVQKIISRLPASYTKYKTDMLTVLPWLLPGCLQRTSQQATQSSTSEFCLPHRQLSWQSLLQAVSCVAIKQSLQFILHATAAAAAAADLHALLWLLLPLLLLLFGAKQGGVTSRGA